MGYVGSFVLVCAATAVEHLIRQTYGHWRLMRQLREHRTAQQAVRIAQLSRDLATANANHERFERLFYLQCQAREENPLFETRVAQYFKDLADSWGEPRLGRNLGIILSEGLTTGDIYEFLDALQAEAQAARQADQQAR